MRMTGLGGGEASPFAGLPNELILYTRPGIRTYANRLAVQRCRMAVDYEVAGIPQGHSLSQEACLLQF